jgi:predicted MFS family arabinose efflux permease
LTFTQGAVISAAGTLTYALLQVPAGLLADRLGARRVFVYGLVGSNLFVAAFALMPSYWPMVANQVGAGVFRALAFAPGLVLVAKLFPEGRRATAVGLFVAGGFAANVVVNSLGPAVVQVIGWRGIFLGLSAIGLVVVGLVSRVTRDVPEVTGELGMTLASAGRILKEPIMWFAAAIQFVRLAVAGGLAFWLPSLLVADKGFALQAAGLTLAMGATLTAISNFVGGYIVDRLRRPMLVIGMSLFVLACGILALGRTTDALSVIALVAVISFFVQVYFGPLFALPVEALRLKEAGFATGFGNFFANLGGVAAVFALGLLKDLSGGFVLGLDALAFLCVVGLLPVVLAYISAGRLRSPAWASREAEC